MNYVHKAELLIEQAVNTKELPLAKIATEIAIAYTLLAIVEQLEKMNDAKQKNKPK